jgi:L-threonylcarbamoyladenylate synthase
LTVILPKNPKLPDEVTAGQATVAVRFPDCAVCHALAAQLGRPLAVTSANLSDLPTPATAQGVAGQLGEDLALVLDGGPSPTAQASTILDVSGERPRLLRQGDLKTAVLRALLPTLVENF